MKNTLIAVLVLCLCLAAAAQNNPITFDPGGGASGDIYGIKATEAGNNTTRLHIYKNFTNDVADLDKLVITATGRVGIGTASPDANFHVYSPGSVGNGNVLSSIMIGKPNGPEIQAIQQSTDDDVQSIAFRVKSSPVYADNNFEAMRIRSNGNVGIGTANPDAKLTVKGDIHTREVRVDLNGVVAPDYVFEENYDLPTLESLQSYIRENKHLPEVPSAKEMEANGIDLGEMNLLLLKKVEELTLHLIEQNGEIQAMKELLQSQQYEIDSLKKIKER